MTDASRITIHIVSSVDGIIAKQDNSVSWFETTDVYEKGVAGEDVDVAGFMKTIDCFVMGPATTNTLWSCRGNMVGHMGMFQLLLLAPEAHLLSGIVLSFITEICIHS